jgi:hypothetical protein
MEHLQPFYTMPGEIPRLTQKVLSHPEADGGLLSYLEEKFLGLKPKLMGLRHDSAQDYGNERGYIFPIHEGLFFNQGGFIWNA